MPKKLDDIIRSPNTAPKKQAILKPSFPSDDLVSRNLIDLGIQNAPERHSLWPIAFVSLLALFFALSFLFKSAEIQVMPKIKKIDLTLELKAEKGKNSALVPFDITVISGEEFKTITAAEEKDIKAPARGIAVFYNLYSDNEQILAKDTRLLGSNGKIYKTSLRLKIPGKTEESPGQAEAEIYATETGEEYNSQPIDLEIIGFKGTNKEGKIYARSRTSIEGGKNGKYFVVGEEETKRMREELKETLKESLVLKGRGQIPEGFILYKEGGILDILEEKVEDKAGGEPGVKLSVKGTLTALLFEEKKLTQAIGREALQDYDEKKDEVRMPEIRDLRFEFLEEAGSDLKDKEEISFKLSGPVSAIWQVNEDKIKEDALGIKKKAFREMLYTHSEIAGATLHLRPLWTFSLPDKKEKIKVIVTGP